MKPLLRSAATIATLVALVALVGSCASPPASAPAAQRPPDPLPPVKSQEASPKDRAALHAELGAGYYERGRMDIALEELNEAVTLDPGNPQIYNYYGLVYAVLGENAKAEQNFQRGARARAGGLRHPAQLGLVPVQQRQAAPVDSRVRDGAAQPAVQDARDRPHQRRALQRRVRRHRERGVVLQARAGALAEQRAGRIRARTARVPRRTPGRSARIHEAPQRAACAPRPKRSSSACASSARPETARPRRPTSPSCATATRTRPRPKSVTTGLCE